MQSQVRCWTRWFGVAALVGSLGCAPPSPSTRVEHPPHRVERSVGTVLFVLTAASEQTLADGATRRTGYFLNEFYEPYLALTEAGYAVVVATPGGRPAVVDPESLDPSYWEERPETLQAARAWVEASPALQQPLTIDEALARADDFQGLVVPGGQGVMMDLLTDDELRRLLVRFGQDHRPVGLVCHAPAILAELPPDNPFAGRLVTSVSGTEEWYIETFVMKGKARDRGIGDRLRALGYRYDSARAGRGHAVRDCSLVTSQNPFSGPRFSELYLAALGDWRRGATCSDP